MPINMSHCRFHNTLEALRECQAALSDDNGSLDSLTMEERAEAKKLFRLCAELAEEYGE